MFIFFIYQSLKQFSYKTSVQIFYTIILDYIIISQLTKTKRNKTLFKVFYLYVKYKAGIHSNKIEKV